jgi:riboflavin biosynthesis pyrimidine reductase
LVVVSDSGRLEPTARALQAGALVITTDQGAANLGRQLPSTSRVVSLGERVTITEALRLIRSNGARSILSEGGPHLVGQLLGANEIDELFLTMSPTICGRTGNDRLGLVEGLSFDPSALPRVRLLSIKQSGSELFLRYRLRN